MKEAADLFVSFCNEKSCIYYSGIYSFFCFLPILGTVFKKKFIIEVGKKWIVVYVIFLKKAKNMKKRKTERMWSVRSFSLFIA